MDFGKVTSLQQLDRISFSLPPEDERTNRILSALKSGSDSSISPCQFYLGCPIWGKKEWVGTLYQPKTAQKDYLKYYAQQFNTIELNSTFYGIPDVATVEKWRSMVPTDFRFSPKVFQGISRFEVLKEIPELTQRFCEAVMQFEKNLGVLFMQLSPSFGPGALIVLRRFFRLLPKGLSFAVEFRHPGWFHQGKLIDSAYELLVENGVSTVISDVAGRRDVLHQSLTTRTAVIRFVGNSPHPSDCKRLNQWIDRIGDWLGKGVNQISFFVHQPNQDGALELMSYLSQELDKKYHLHFRKWNPALAKPLQSELFG